MGDYCKFQFICNHFNECDEFNECKKKDQIRSLFRPRYRGEKK